MRSLTVDDVTASKNAEPKLYDDSRRVLRVSLISADSMTFSV